MYRRLFLYDTPLSLLLGLPGMFLDVINTFDVCLAIGGHYPEDFPGLAAILAGQYVNYVIFLYLIHFIPPFYNTSGASDMIFM